MKIRKREGLWREREREREREKEETKRMKRDMEEWERIICYAWLATNWTKIVVETRTTQLAMWKVEKVSINFERNSRLRRIKKTEFYLSRLRRNRETCTRELSDKTPRSSLPYNIFRFLFLLEIRPRVASNI